MAFATHRNTNSFGLLGSLDPENNLCATVPQRNLARKAARGPAGVTGKPHRNADPQCDLQRPCNPISRPTGNNRPRPADTRPRSYPIHRKTPPNLPPSRPQNQQENPRGGCPGACGPPLKPCPDVIDPCLTATPTCPTNDICNLQLKEYLRVLQKPASATGQGMCTPMFNPIPRPNPTQDTIVPQSMTECAASPPRSPVVALYSTANAAPSVDSCKRINANLPPPPGLPKPGLTVDHIPPPRKAFNRECRPNYVVADSERSRPMDANHVSTPPPGASSGVVKSITTKDAPRSPSTASSSLSEDASGSSSTRRSGSDTTFTSVESKTSSKMPWPFRKRHEMCRNWSRGFPCFSDPCPYIHERLEQPPASAPAERPTWVLSAVQPPSATAKTSANVRGQNNFTPPPKQDASSGSVKPPPPRPEPLYATTISDHIKVRFDQGFEVREVVTGFESRWVHLGNIDSSVTSAALHELLGPYKVDTMNLPESPLGKSLTVKVQFASSADALKAVADLNGIEFAGRTISAKSAINNSLRGSTVVKDTDVQLVWECPSRVGYAGYDTLKDAKAALDSIDGKPCEHVIVTAQLYEGIPCIGAYNVIFKQLPASMTEQALRKFAKTNSVMMGRPNYQSLDKAIASIRSRLEEYGTVTGFDVIAAPYRDGLVKAWAHFTSPAEARAAQEDMDRRRPKAMGHTTLTCRHTVSVSHVLSAVSYRGMQEDIRWLRDSWHRRYGPTASLREKPKENMDDDLPVHIRISSDTSELLSILKYEFEQLLHGDTVMLEKKPLWDNFFVTEAGHAFVAQVHARYPGVQVQVQQNRRVLSLWGPIDKRQHARKEIVSKIMELKEQQFWKIPLAGRLLGTFCSSELSTLQDLLGHDNCILDIGERVLVVRGNDAAFQVACSAVQAAQAAQSRQDHEVRSSDATCPVCFGEAIVPVSLACGHRWCRACLTGYLTSAVENKMFPLRCLGNDATCTQHIPLGLSRKILSAADFGAVLEASFWVYVHSRPNEFYHCPTPDCTQVYRSAPPNAVLQCPSCLARICPACRIEYHDGLTCEERDVADDKLFKEWTAEHNVKGCPGCKAPIERSEGCNHVTCTRCQTHICWECLATFPKGAGIYDHMRMQHGSIGL